MVKTKIFQYKQTTSYIFELDEPAPEPERSAPMAEVPSIVVPAASAVEDVVQSYGEDIVEVILSSETDAGGTVMYMVRFGDGGEYPVSERTSRSEILVKLNEQNMDLTMCS